MGTITTRKGKKGTTYRAQIRIREKGQIVHEESQSFPRKSMAQEWVKRRESELASGRKPTDKTLGDVLRAYLDEFGGGRTKTMDIKHLLAYDICGLPVHALTSRHLVDHIRKRRENVGAATASNDLIWIRTALKTMSALQDLRVDLSAIEQASTVCRKYGLIAKSKSRHRRPTPDELTRLSDHFKSRDNRADIPMYVSGRRSTH